MYHQQYQLHRFIEQIYHKPVAVNDLGWTSYHNQDYVLDLWGLGSAQARELRKTATTPQWMDTLMREKHIDLAMIYHTPQWFADVPDNWVKIAELDITGPKITAWYPVSLYVREPSQAQVIKKQLEQFSADLPEGTVLKISP